MPSSYFPASGYDTSLYLEVKAESISLQAVRISPCHLQLKATTSGLLDEHPVPSGKVLTMLFIIENVS